MNASLSGPRGLTAQKQLLTRLIFFSLFLFYFLLLLFVSLQQNMQATLGADVTLQCQITTDERISVLKWSRPDLNTDGYVYFYRNKRSYENYQHPSFHGRVKLRDPEMKDGDVSVILKNVTFNDTGMYECHIAVRNPVRSKRAHTEISHFIELTVTGEFVMPTANRTILIVAAVAAVAVVIAVVISVAVGLLVLLLKRNKKQRHILLRKNQFC
uniref:Ig-like domain-containing protein n=1 Tax=Pundamilia nyererei TaxID=303518 RepID=A0A3B4GX33_9CICH